MLTYNSLHEFVGKSSTFVTKEGKEGMSVDECLSTPEVSLGGRCRPNAVHLASTGAK